MDNKLKREFFSIPNIMSYFRILLIPVFVILFFNSGESVGYHIASAAVLIVSGLTDMLDGKIARKFNQITEWGKIIDPVADKLTQCAVMICLAMHYELLWVFIGILVIKEITMAVLAFLFMKKGRKLKGAHWYGKVSTTVFYLVIITLLAVPVKYMLNMPFELSTVLILISGTCMIFAFVMYIRVYISMWRDIKENKPNRRY